MPNLAKRFASSTEVFNTPIQNRTTTPNSGSDFVDERKYNIDTSTLTGTLPNYDPYYGFNVDNVAIPTDITDPANQEDPYLTYDFYGFSLQGFVFDMIATKAPLIQYSNFTSFTGTTPNTSNHKGGYFEDDPGAEWHRQQGYLVTAYNYTTGDDPVTNPGTPTMRIQIYGMPFLYDVKNSDSMSIYQNEVLGFNFLHPSDSFTGTPGSNNAEELATDYQVANTVDSPATLGGSTLLFDITDTASEYFRYYSNAVDGRVTDIQFVRYIQPAGSPPPLNLVPQYVDVLTSGYITRYNTNYSTFVVPGGGVSRYYSRLNGLDTGVGKTHIATDSFANTSGHGAMYAPLSFEWAENGYNCYFLGFETGGSSTSYRIFRFEASSPWDYSTLTQVEMYKGGSQGSSRTGGVADFGIQFSVINSFGGKIRLNRGYQSDVRLNGQGNASYTSSDYNLKISVSIGGGEFYNNDRNCTKGFVHTLDTGSGTSSLGDDGQPYINSSFRSSDSTILRKRAASRWDERMCKGVSRSMPGWTGHPGCLSGWAVSFCYVKHLDDARIHEKVRQVIIGTVDSAERNRADGMDFFLRSIKVDDPKFGTASNGLASQRDDLLLETSDVAQDPDTEALDIYDTELRGLNGSSLSNISFEAILWSPDGLRLIYHVGLQALSQVSLTTPYDLSTADWDNAFTLSIQWGSEGTGGADDIPFSKLKWISAYDNSSGTVNEYEQGLAIGVIGRGDAVGSVAYMGRYFWRGQIDSANSYNVTYNRFKYYQEFVLKPAGGDYQNTPFDLRGKTLEAAYMLDGSTYRRKYSALRQRLLYDVGAGFVPIKKWDNSITGIINDPVVGAPNSTDYDTTKFLYDYGHCDFEFYDQGKKCLWIISQSGPNKFDRYATDSRGGSQPYMRRMQSPGDGHGQEIWIDMDLSEPYKLLGATPTYNAARKMEFDHTQAFYNYIDYAESHFRFSYLAATQTPIAFKLLDDGRKMIRLSDPAITQIVSRPYTRWVPNVVDEPSFASNTSFPAEIAKKCLFGPYSYMKSRKRKVNLVQQDGIEDVTLLAQGSAGSKLGNVFAKHGNIGLASCVAHDNPKVIDLSTGSVLRELSEPASWASSSQTGHWGNFNSAAIVKAANVNYAVLGHQEYDGTSQANEGRAYLFNLDTGALLHEIACPAVTSGDARFGSHTVGALYMDRYEDPGAIFVIGAYTDNNGGTDHGSGHVYYWDIYNNSISLLLSFSPNDAAVSGAGIGCFIRDIAPYSYASFYNDEDTDNFDPDFRLYYQEAYYPTGFNNATPDGRVVRENLLFNKTSRYGTLTCTKSSPVNYDPPTGAAYIFGEVVKSFGNPQYVTPSSSVQPTYISARHDRTLSNPTTNDVGVVFVYDSGGTHYLTVQHPQGNTGGGPGSRFKYITPFTDGTFAVGAPDYSVTGSMYVFDSNGDLQMTLSGIDYDLRPPDSTAPSSVYVLKFGQMPTETGLMRTTSENLDHVALYRKVYINGYESNNPDTGAGNSGAIVDVDLNDLNLEEIVAPDIRRVGNLPSGDPSFAMHRSTDTLAFYKDTVFYGNFQEGHWCAPVSFDCDPEGKNLVASFGSSDIAPIRYLNPNQSIDCSLLGVNDKKRVRNSN